MTVASPHTVRSLLRDTPLDAVDARLLMAHALNWTRVQMITRDLEALSPAQVAAWHSLAQRRMAGEPVAYLLGTREFFGLTLKVSPAVLIPRPETELLVELALAKCAARPHLRLLDLGTGSGAIAIALAAHVPSTAHITATDASAAALAMAQMNAALALTSSHAPLQFVQGSWYEALPATTQPFDVIVSNPPYIAARDPHLSQGDLRFEPTQALTDGADGMSALRNIISAAPLHLRPKGWLLLEHGYDQAEAVQAQLREAGFSAIFSAPDLAGILRVTGGCYPPALVP